MELTNHTCAVKQPKWMREGLQPNCVPTVKLSVSVCVQKQNHTYTYWTLINNIEDYIYASWHSYRCPTVITNPAELAIRHNKLVLWSRISVTAVKSEDVSI